MAQITFCTQKVIVAFNSPFWHAVTFLQKKLKNIWSVT